MFDKPEVGKTVTVVTDWSDLFALHVPHVRANNSIQKDIGEVIPSESWDDPKTFRITTGRPEFPASVVPLERVIELSYSDGSETNTIEVEEKEDKETWVMKGSKGSSYLVTRNGDKWSCECPGWNFRGQCKHVNEKKQEVLDRSK